MLWVKNRDEMYWGTVQHGKEWQTWLLLASMLSHFNRINKICEHKFFSESTQVPETQNLSTQVAANAMHVLHDMNYSHFVRNLTKKCIVTAMEFGLKKLPVIMSNLLSTQTTTYLMYITSAKMKFCSLFQKFSLLPQQRGNVYLIHSNTQTATRMDAQTNDNVNTML